VLIELRAVSVSFGSRAVLDGADLAVDRGEVVALMGPSGAGKSTLLSLASGDLLPDAGTVSTVSRQDIAWILQSTPVFTHRTALDNVSVGALSRGCSRADAERIAMDVMGRLRVEHLASQKLYNLSGGERQRIAVARAICAQSSLVLADEPTASLDASSRELVVDSLLRAAEWGASVLIATHDPVVADRCHRTHSLDSGRLVKAPRRWR
jgi:ABC-type lipoprotein export system ATPase subunit